jgi:hypothetical protein
LTSRIIIMTTTHTHSSTNTPSFSSTSPYYGRTVAPREYRGPYLLTPSNWELMTPDGWKEELTKLYERSDAYHAQGIHPELLAEAVPTEPPAAARMILRERIRLDLRSFYAAHRDEAPDAELERLHHYPTPQGVQALLVGGVDSTTDEGALTLEGLIMTITCVEALQAFVQGFLGKLPVDGPWLPMEEVETHWFPDFFQACARLACLASVPVNPGHGFEVAFTEDQRPHLTPTWGEYATQREWIFLPQEGDATWGDVFARFPHMELLKMVAYAANHTRTQVRAAASIIHARGGLEAIGEAATKAAPTGQWEEEADAFSPADAAWACPEPGETGWRGARGLGPVPAVVEEL